MFGPDRVQKVMVGSFWRLSLLPICAKEKMCFDGTHEIACGSTFEPSFSSKEQGSARLKRLRTASTTLVGQLQIGLDFSRPS